MTVRTDVLLWAQRTIARKDEPAHVLLELPADAGFAAAQEAFHKLARTAHPDLHRTGLNADELELVTRAYAIAAGAYQTMRVQTSGAGTRLPEAAGPTRPTPAPSANVPSHTPGRDAPPPSPIAGGDAPPLGATASAAQALSGKALLYYRKAELCLKRGDLKGAVLQIKLAIATDPGSALLRTALAEIDAELRRNT
jgi:hypothetical protein